MQHVSVYELREHLREAMTRVPPQSWWQHYKTKNFYQVINACIREGDLTICILYYQKGCPDVLFCRPAGEWLSVVKEGTEVLKPITRFIPVEGPG